MVGTVINEQNMSDQSDKNLYGNFPELYPESSQTSRMDLLS